MKKKRNNRTQGLPEAAHFVWPATADTPTSRASRNGSCINANIVKMNAADMFPAKPGITTRWRDTASAMTASIKVRTGSLVGLICDKTDDTAMQKPAVMTAAPNRVSDLEIRSMKIYPTIVYIGKKIENSID
ncbi:MAG: hypothetical protein ACK6DY_02160 [Acidobacteriota bacterium]